MSTTNISDSSTSTTDSGGASPGAILRRCREFHEITLEEASDTTKIGLTHLKALEDDRIHEFANKAYLKGFLRIYATYLGLNSDDIARMYEKLFGVQDDKPVQPRKSNSSGSDRKRFSPKKMIIPVFFLALILITATFFKRPPSPIVRKPLTAALTVPPPLQNITTLAVKKSEQTIIPEIKANQTERTKTPPEVVPPEPVALSKSTENILKSFTLRIKAINNGTLLAVVDGSKAEFYELKVGDVIEWRAEKKIALELNNPGGIDVELNDKPYKQLGASDTPLYVELDANGVIP